MVEENIMMNNIHVPCFYEIAEPKVLSLSLIFDLCKGHNI